MTILYKNNAASTLSAGLSIAATSMSLVAGDNFPVVVAPDVAYLTIENATNFEIVKVTARALGSNTPTIVRAQDGTTDRAWLTGAVVSLRWTSASAQSAANAQDVAAAALTAHEAAANPHPDYTTTAELNTGLATKQAADAALTSLAGLVLVAGDTLYATGADALQRLPAGTAAQQLRMNAGATAPEWVTPAATGVTSVSGTAPVASSGGPTPAISMAAASAGANGFMSAGYASKLDGIQAGANYFVGVALNNGAEAIGSFRGRFSTSIDAVGGDYALAPGTWRCHSAVDTGMVNSGSVSVFAMLYQRIA